MSAPKLVMLLIYAVLAALALGVAGPVGSWPAWVLLVLAVVHAIETVVFYREYKNAAGSLPGHIVNVFLFGILHMQELRRQRA